MSLPARTKVLGARPNARCAGIFSSDSICGELCPHETLPPRKHHHHATFGIQYAGAISSKVKPLFCLTLPAPPSPAPLPPAPEPPRPSTLNSLPSRRGPPQILSAGIPQITFCAVLVFPHWGCEGLFVSLTLATPSIAPYIPRDTHTQHTHSPQQPTEHPTATSTPA